MGQADITYSNVSTDDASLEDISPPIYQRSKSKSLGKSFGTLCHDAVVKIKRISFAGVKDSCIAFWRNTIIDLKKVSWLHLLHILIRDIVPVLFIVALVIAIATMAEIRAIAFPKSLCRPDGTVDDGELDPYNPWKSSETFTINISFGKFKVLSFGTAKLVDATSDIVSHGL